jgi:spermidine/putrescine transport system substrate-binding protein
VAPPPTHALTRRAFLRRIAALGTVVSLASFLEACVAAASPSSAPTPGETHPAPPGTPTVAPTATPVATPAPAHEAELSVYGWDGYLADDTVAGFEARYGIKVRYEAFIDEGTQLATLRGEGAGGGIDVTYPSSLVLPALIDEKIVRRLDPSLVPNLANLAPEWRSPIYDPGNEHSVPNYWWTTGVAWDPAKTAKTVARWSDLWDASLDGHLGVLDDMRLAFAMGAFALGFSPNTTSDDDLDLILSKLQDLKPLVGAWTSDPIGDLEGGTVSVTQCGSREWLAMTADVPAAQYAIPAEGAIRGNDTMAVLSGAKHPIAAHLWIDYNLSPEVAAKNANAIGWMTPNRAAVDRLDAAIRGDARVNPPNDVVARLQDLAPLAAADLEKYTTRWELLRAPAG